MNKKGQILVIVPVVVLFLIGMVFLCLNIHILTFKKIRLQNVADLSAKQGAHEYAQLYNTLSLLNDSVFFIYEKFKTTSTDTEWKNVLNFINITKNNVKEDYKNRIEIAATDFANKNFIEIDQTTVITDPDKINYFDTGFITFKSGNIIDEKVTLFLKSKPYSVLGKFFFKKFQSVFPNQEAKSVARIYCIDPVSEILPVKYLYPISVFRNWHAKLTTLKPHEPIESEDQYQADKFLSSNERIGDNLNVFQETTALFDNNQEYEKNKSNIEDIFTSIPGKIIIYNSVDADPVEIENPKGDPDKRTIIIKVTDNFEVLRMEDISKASKDFSSIPIKDAVCYKGDNGFSDLMFISYREAVDKNMEDFLVSNPSLKNLGLNCVAERQVVKNMVDYKNHSGTFIYKTQSSTTAVEQIEQALINENWEVKSINTDLQNVRYYSKPESFAMIVYPYKTNYVLLFLEEKIKQEDNGRRRYGEN